jgi:hypothetical protein
MRWSKRLSAHKYINYQIQSCTITAAAAEAAALLLRLALAWAAG